jgi:hypothetical protein
MTIHEGIFNRNRIRDKPYTQKYIASLIGEKEGKKWLIEQGYSVYLFAFFEHTFNSLNDTIERMKRRRKQEYMEKDRLLVESLETQLKHVLGQDFETMKKFFLDFSPRRIEIHKSTRERMRAERRYIQIGGISPDFIVKKNDAFSIVEVKANTSKPTKHQKMCFDMAKNYGFNSMVLNVTVENRLVKEIRLLPY